MRYHTENIKVIQITILKELRSLQFPEEKLLDLKKFLADDYTLADNLASIDHFSQQVKVLIHTHKSKLLLRETFSYKIVLIVFGIFLISQNYSEWRKSEDSYSMFPAILKMIMGLCTFIPSLLSTEHDISDCSRKINMVINLLHSLDRDLAACIKKNIESQVANLGVSLNIPTLDQRVITETKLIPVPLEKKLITYAYRKVIVGDYLQKTLLVSVMRFLCNRIETGGSIIVAGGFLGITAIKALTYFLDKRLLERHVTSETQKKTKIISKNPNTESSALPVTEVTLWGDILIYGPAFLWLLGIISLSDLYNAPRECIRFMTLIKSALLFFAVGSDGVINRLIIKTNDARLVQKWDQSQLQIVTQQLQKTVMLIRNLFSIALPEVDHQWEQDDTSAYTLNTLTYFIHPHFKKNPNRMKLLKSIKIMLSEHLLPPFEIKENKQEIQFLIPYWSDETVINSSFLKEEIVYLRSLIIRATEIYPALKNTDWDIHRWWKNPGKVRQSGIIIRRGQIPKSIYETMKVQFSAQYLSSLRGLLLYAVIPIEPSLQKKEEKLPPIPVPLAPNSPREVKHKVSEKRNPIKKEKEITEKITAILRLIPDASTIISSQENHPCIKVKMPIHLLQSKLQNLKEAHVTKSGNGASLLIQFEKNIQIRVMGEMVKPPKKIKNKRVSTKTPVQEGNQSEIKQTHPIGKEEASSGALSRQKGAESKWMEITVVNSARAFLPIKEPLLDQAVSAILEAISTKLTEVTGKDFDFSNPAENAHILLTKFIHLSYIIKTMLDQLTIRAFGGVWRSLLMEEDINDVDIVIFIPQDFEVENDLFKKLRQLKVISEYRKSDKLRIDLYTVNFLNTIFEITIFKTASTNKHARTLNYNCNILSLEILRFYRPVVEFYMPLNSPRFVSAVKNNKAPVIESVINPEDHVFLLENPTIKSQVIHIMEMMFPSQVSTIITWVIEKIVENPKEYENVPLESVSNYLLTILTYIYDPKRVFNLLTLHQSNQYQISRVHYNIIFNFLIPKIFSTIVVLDEKPVYPIIQRQQLFYYFQDYIVKNTTKKQPNKPLLSHLELLKTVLMAGINLGIKEKDEIDKIFREADPNAHDPQISFYLSHSIQSLSNKQDTRAIDVFFTLITLTRLQRIFSSINKSHRDPDTFAQFYLLPAFKKERIAIAAFFHYVPKEPELISGILLDKWREYSTKPSFSNSYRFTHYSKNFLRTPNIIKDTHYYPV